MLKRGCLCRMLRWGFMLILCITLGNYACFSSEKHSLGNDKGFTILNMGGEILAIAREGGLQIVASFNLGDKSTWTQNQTIQVDDAVRALSNKLSVNYASSGSYKTRTCSLVNDRGYLYWLVERSDKNEVHLLMITVKVLITGVLDGFPTYVLSNENEEVIAECHEDEVNGAPFSSKCAVMNGKIYVGTTIKAGAGLISFYTYNGDEEFPFYNFKTTLSDRTRYDRPWEDGYWGGCLLDMMVLNEFGEDAIITAWSVKNKPGVITCTYFPQRSFPKGEGYGEDVKYQKFFTDKDTLYLNGVFEKLPLAICSSSCSESSLLINFGGSVYGLRMILNEDGADFIACNEDTKLFDYTGGPSFNNMGAYLVMSGREYGVRSAPVDMNLSWCLVSSSNGPATDGFCDMNDLSGVPPNSPGLGIGVLIMYDKISGGKSESPKTETMDEDVAKALITPVCIIYYPPIVFPEDPAEPYASREHWTKEIEPRLVSCNSCDDLRTNKELLSLLWESKSFYGSGNIRGFEAEWNADHDEPAKNYMWLFEKGDAGRGVSFLKSVFDNTVFTWSTNKGFQMSETADKTTTIGGALELGNEWLKANVANAIDDGWGNSSSTSMSCTSSISTDNYFLDIHKNAVFIYWESHMLEQYLYSYTLQKSKDENYDDSYTFNLLYNIKAPELKYLPFDPEHPGLITDENGGTHSYHPLLKGIKPVPRSYNVLSKDQEPMQKKYKWLRWWNERVDSGTLYKSDIGYAGTTIQVSGQASTMKGGTIDFGTSGENTLSMGGNLSGGGELNINIDKIFEIGASGTKASAFSTTTSVSNASAVGYDMNSQGGVLSLVTNTGGDRNCLVMPELTFYAYAIFEKEPRVDKMDWWVADIWRETGVAPWVMYYDAGSKPLNKALKPGN